MVIEANDFSGELYAIGGMPWFSTPQGTYRVNGNTVEKIADYGTFLLKTAKEIGDAVWVAVDGQIRQVGSASVRKIPNIGSPILSIEEVDGRIFLEAEDGTYLLGQDKATKISDERLYGAEKFGGRTWLSFPDGVYRLDGDTLTKLSGLGSPGGMKEIDGRVWVVSSTGIFRVEGDTARRFPEIDFGECRQHFKVFQCDVEKIAGSVWLRTDKGLFRVVGDSAFRVGNMEFAVLDIKAIGQTLWLRTSLGAFSVSGDAVTQVLSSAGFIRTITAIEEIAGQVWLCTTSGLYLVEGNKARRIPDVEISIYSIDNLGGRLWLRTDQGAYRLDP
jgi:ligand-binding sensor domain-containing protein